MHALRKRLPSLSLTLVAMIWGGGFMATQIAIDAGLTPGYITASRFLTAALAMLAVMNAKLFPMTKRELRYGAIAGLLLFLGFYAQVLGLHFTTPSNNGFFTACNVIMVPLIAWVLHRKRPPIRVFVCGLIALCGFFVLSYRPETGFSANAGDLLTLLCAFFFACHIAATGLFAARVDTAKLCFLQLVFAGAFSLLPLFSQGLEAVLEPDILSSLPSILYLGLFSTCLCFFLQVWAQVRLNSGRAAVIMSTEALWCAVFSVLMGFEPLTWQMTLGGLIVVGAICLLEAGAPQTETPDNRKNNRDNGSAPMPTLPDSSGQGRAHFNADRL